MPNANRAAGLSPVHMITGAPYNGQARMYSILAADTSAYAIGDPVVSDAGGASARGIAAVKLAAATGPIRGVIVGIFDEWPGVYTSSIIRSSGAKNKDWYVMVVDDPNVVFEVQEGPGTPLTAADVGLNANLLPGTNTGFVSGWTLDTATELSTATLQVKILQSVQRADNEIGQYAKWLVKINNHELAGGTGTLGV